MSNTFQLVLIFSSVILGIISATYFYQSAGIFVTKLRKPLHYISTGMFVIAAGTMLAAFISYEASMGVNLNLAGVPLSAFFYFFYIIGSACILVGARQFSVRPKGM